MKMDNIEDVENRQEELSQEKHLFEEYTLGAQEWNEELQTQEININPYSLSFFLKSLFCANSSAVFVSSFINFYQELDISTLEEPHFYSITSNAATLFMLKTFEKSGAVKIIEYNDEDKSEDWDICQYFKNQPKRTKLKKYNMLFYKLRDLNKTDLYLIREIERTLHIAKYQLKVKFFEGEMYTRLSYLESIKCIFTGHIFIQFKKNLSYWKEAEGFINDLSVALSNLRRKNKPTTK